MSIGLVRIPLETNGWTKSAEKKMYLANLGAVLNRAKQIMWNKCLDHQRKVDLQAVYFVIK